MKIMPMTAPILAAMVNPLESEVSRAVIGAVVTSLAMGVAVVREESSPSMGMSVVCRREVIALMQGGTVAVEGGRHTSKSKSE